jgi:hypothetical protein
MQDHRLLVAVRTGHPNPADVEVRSQHYTTSHRPECTDLGTAIFIWTKSRLSGNNAFDDASRFDHLAFHLDGGCLRRDKTDHTTAAIS